MLAWILSRHHVSLNPLLLLPDDRRRHTRKYRALTTSTTTLPCWTANASFRIPKFHFHCDNFFFNLYFWSRSKPYLRVLSAYRPYQELSPKFHFRCFSSLSKQPQVFSVRLIPWFPWVLSGMPIAHGHSNGAFWFTHQRFHFHRAPLQCLGGCLLQKLKMPQETPPSYSFFLQVLHHALLLC